MSIAPINVAAALLLERRATGAPLTPPITGVLDPAIEQLLMARLENGSVSKAQYAEASRTTNLSKRQLQRRLADLLRNHAPTENALVQRRAFALTEHHMQVIMACGNVQLAYDQLLEAGETLPSYTTFWRAFDALPSGVRAYMRHGAQELVNFWLYPPYQAPARNEVWQADHFELPVDVVAECHTTTLVKPWLTVFEDDRTRLVMSWALVAQPGTRPGADVVCATICDGVRIRLEGDVEVGGVPRIVRWDNDASFNAGSVIQLGTAVGFECHAVPPYSGHMKGKVERLGRRIQEEFCVLQPGYTHGPATYTGKDPFRDTPPLTAEELRARLALYFATYNTTRHQSLGMSPREAWEKDATPLRQADDQQLRSALLVAPRPYTVNQRKGVHFKGQWWQGAGMLEVVGRKVEIRYPINDDSFIEVYYQGKWVCTGWPTLSLTDDQKKALWRGRDTMYREVRELHDEAREMRIGADAAVGTTDATPSMASMPAADRLAPDADDLYALLCRLDPQETTDDPTSPSEVAS